MPLASTRAQAPALPPEWEKIRVALEKYHDPYVAVRDGYLPTIGCVHYPKPGGAGQIAFAIGGMGIHFLNPELIGGSVVRAVHQFCDKLWTNHGTNPFFQPGAWLWEPGKRVWQKVTKKISPPSIPPPKPEGNTRMLALGRLGDGIVNEFTVASRRREPGPLRDSDMTRDYGHPRRPARRLQPRSSSDSTTCLSLCRRTIVDITMMNDLSGALPRRGGSFPVAAFRRL